MWWKKIESSTQSQGDRYMKSAKKHSFLFVSAPFGGINVYFENLRDVLSSRDDIETTWVFIEFYPKELIARLPPVSTNWTLKGGLLTRLRIGALERSGQRFDAAIVNHLIPLFFLKKFMRRVPTLISCDGTPIIFDPYKELFFKHPIRRIKFQQDLKKAYAQRRFESAAYLLAWSLLAKESLISDYGIREDKIAVVPPGINPKRWVPPRRENTAGKTGAVTKILFVGGDFKRKGGDLVLRVAQEPEFQRCEFHIVTKDYFGSGGGNVKIYNNVGANSEEGRSLFREADIFVLPTRADFSPTMVLCEALAMELPVITTRVGGLDEIVIDGENGFVIPVDDEGALRDRLRRLVSSPEMRVRFGHNGRKLIESKYNLEKNAEQVVEYLTRAATETSDDQYAQKPPFFQRGSLIL